MTRQAMGFILKWYTPLAELHYDNMRASGEHTQHIQDREGRLHPAPAWKANVMGPAPFRAP